MKLSFALTGLGTIGKTVEILLSQTFPFYKRNGLPMVSFDSDKSLPISVPLLTKNNQIDLSIDGNDVAAAMRNGKFSPMKCINPSLLKTYKHTSAMGLLPSMGKLASMVHKQAIRASVEKLIKMSSKGGEITLIRIFSSFGGTSRGTADEINEVLWDLAQSSGLRIQIMDIVVIPGLATSSSKFHKEYQRNTYAFLKEISALRTGRRLRLLNDDDGNPCDDRHSFLPHTLVLVNDTQKEKGALPLEDLLATVARFCELLTREEISTLFHGAATDLERHNAAAPFADRLGMFSLYVRNREAKMSRQLEISIEVLNRLIDDNIDTSTLANRLLKDIGLYASEAEQLKGWKRIKEQLNNTLGMNPLEIFRELYFDNPNDYFSRYEELKEEVEAINIEEIVNEIFALNESKSLVDDQINSLKKDCPPSKIHAVLNEALSILEKERDDLEHSVYVENSGIMQRIEEYEDNANQALTYFLKAKRRKKGNALSEVKKHLLAALELRVKTALVKGFCTLIARFLDAIGKEEFKTWPKIEREAQDIVQALRDIRDEQTSYCQSLQNGQGLYRGNSAPLEAKKVNHVTEDTIRQRLLTDIRNFIKNVYGNPPNVIKKAISSHIQTRMNQIFQFDDVLLTPELLSQETFNQALKSAMPLLMVDSTNHAHRGAVFCLTPLENGKEMLEEANVETGINMDREIFQRAKGVNDELVLMTYEKGVLLSGIKSVLECRKEYNRTPERYKGHLLPIFELLPDPVGNFDEKAGKKYLLMGLITESVSKTGEGYIYFDLENLSHNVTDISFFSDYERAVEIASRFIVNLGKSGFAPAMRQIERAKSMTGFEHIAGELYSTLERLSTIYQGGIQ